MSTRPTDLEWEAAILRYGLAFAALNLAAPRVTICSTDPSPATACLMEARAAILALRDRERASPVYP